MRKLGIIPWSNVNVNGLYFYDVLCYVLKYILFILKVFFLIFSWFVNFLFLLLDFVKSRFIILILKTIHFNCPGGITWKHKAIPFFSPLTLELKMEAFSLDFIWDNTISLCNQLLWRWVLNFSNNLLMKKSEYRRMCARAVNCKSALIPYHGIAVFGELPALDWD